MITTVPRTFQYMGMQLDDPDPRMSLDQVKAHFTNVHPEMLNATMEGGDFDGTSQVFVIRRATGTKG